MKTCDDCGKAVQRRQRCQICDVSICGRCYQHNHPHEYERRKEASRNAAWDHLYGTKAVRRADTISEGR